MPAPRLLLRTDGTLAARFDAGNTTTSHVAFAPDGRTMYVCGGIDGDPGRAPSSRST